MEDCEENPRRESSLDYYRTISLFSSFCIGLCMFGMIVGFVSNSAANQQLWGVLSVIFLISQSLLHFVDKFTRDQLSRLPVYLLNATRPILLLRLYYIGLFVDIITLILTLIISYFFKFPQPISATLWFILLTTSWYNTNELRTYFIKSLEDVPSCSDAGCIFHTKLYNNNNNNNNMTNKKQKNINQSLTKLKQTMKIGKSKTIILTNRFEKIVYCYNRQIHYHYNSYQHVLTSLDAIKSWSCVYIMIYCIWTISFIQHSLSSTTTNMHHNWGFILLLIMTIIQLIRISFQIWALSRQQPQRAKKHKNKNVISPSKKENLNKNELEQKEEKTNDTVDPNPFATLILILLSPFSLRILILICSILSGLVFVYGVNNETNRSDIFTTWATGFQISRHQYLIICYGLSLLLIIISIIFLIRFISQLSYLQSTGQASYYKTNKQKDTKSNKKNVNTKPDNDNKYDMNINAFLNFANQRLSDNLMGRNDRARGNRESTLSTIDSSELIRDNNASLDHLDFTFEIDHEDDDEEDHEENDEEEDAEMIMEEYNKIKIMHKRKSDMSLVGHIWFRMPYDKYFRITCCILSIMIILQTISISPNVLTVTYRRIMLVITFCNVFILLRITWSSSFMICWQFSESLRNHLVFPQLFLMSYMLGILSTNIGVIYMILRIYYLVPNDYETEDFSDSDGDNNIMSLNCSYYECFNSIIMMATWWPISILINNENARFLDRYRKYNESINNNHNISNNNKLFIVPSPTLSSSTSTTTQSPSPYNNLIALQNKYYYKSYFYSHHNKNMHKICGFVFKSHFPWINSIDGARPLIPILFLLLLLSIEIGLIQWDNCLSNSRLLLSCIVIFLVASRGILLIVSI